MPTLPPAGVCETIGLATLIVADRGGQEATGAAS